MSQLATHTGSHTNTSDRISLAVLGVMFCGGLWLMAAPFIVGYQDRTTHWTDGTISIFTVGGSITVLALATVVISAVKTLVGLSRTAATTQHDNQTETTNPA